MAVAKGLPWLDRPKYLDGGAAAFPLWRLLEVFCSILVWQIATAQVAVQMSIVLSGLALPGAYILGCCQEGFVAIVLTRLLVWTD